MKRLAVFLLCSVLAFGSDEIKRPTSDSDPGSTTWATTNCGLGTYSTNTLTGSLARDSAGQTTSVSYSRSGGSLIDRLTSRQWVLWDAPAQTYTALTLNVNSTNNASTGSRTVALVYTTNGGTSWTVIRSGSSWAKTTDSIALSATQDFTQLRVGVCLWGEQDTGTGAGNAHITISDIWTDGVYSVTNTGAGNTNSKRHRGSFL